jgi:hypothetical protein
LQARLAPSLVSNEKPALVLLVRAPTLEVRSGTAGAGPCCTTTSNLLEARLPELSTAEHVTFVVPTWKIEPELGVQLTTGAGSPLSVASGRLYCTTVSESES